MKVDYIAQPDTQLGKVLSKMLDADPPASRIVFVSAFVSLQTIMRLKQQILDLQGNGVDISFVLGIDLGGTSQEVLKEILGWNIDTKLVKHRRPGHTFHPKLYLFEWKTRGTIIIGSNNITDGGFFGNYEGAARITFVYAGCTQQPKAFWLCLSAFAFGNPQTKHNILSNRILYMDKVLCCD